MVRRTERFEVVWPEEFEAVRVSEDRAEDIARLYLDAQAPLFNHPEGGDWEACRYDVWRYFSHHCRNPWWPTFLKAGTMVYDRASGRLVGVCLCAGSQTEGHIFNIFVAPAFRRRGIATRMLQHALTVFETFNLVVDLNCETEEGRKTYESVGFVALDEGCRSRANQRLLAAASRGMIDDVQALLTGPDVNARTEDGTTPLALAKENGHEEVAEFLAAHGGRE
jgi:ribosomal protein S18 acetylase RimI-like enzyme